VSVYLDVSVLVPFFVVDPFNQKAEQGLRRLRDGLTISDFAAAEFASAIARRVRTRELRADEGQAAFSDFDTWCARHVQQIAIESADVVAASALMRRLDLTLRTPDAIHLAMAHRTESRLWTFDKDMARAARAVGVELAKV
jgi:predicted nucleic acid-binding protein